MIKSVSLIKRKAGMPREAFRKYYEEVHATLARQRFHTTKYARNYAVVPPSALEPDFDCTTEFWYESIEDAKSAAKVWKHQGRSGDEATFMDIARSSLSR